MTVEMEEAERARPARQCAQQREGYRVVPAQCDNMPEGRRLLLDFGEATLDVAVRDRQIADVGEIQALHFGPRRRVVTIDQNAARLTDRRRPEPCSGSVRGTEIEWNAGDADRRV